MTGAADGGVPGYLGRVLDSGAPTGTCFQVAPGVLVTAWHVLDDIGAAADDARVWVDPLVGGQAFEAVVARLDRASDLAVLVCSVHLPASAGVLAASDQVAPRSPVTVTGHCVITDSGRTARSLITTGWWYGPARWEDGVPTGRMTAEALLPGMSGAPVISDIDGAVTGVVSGRYNSADDWLKGTVWVARTEDLAVLLDGIAEVTMRQASAASPVAGWPLADVSDPFALEVHRPVQPEDQQPGLPELPAYMPRDHDAELAEVIRAAAEGSSGMAVLVGGSSTGKTRACWEALSLLRDEDPPWRLWHPIDPSRPEAALAELPAIGPRTLVWLNEAQFYLTADGGLGERVAAGLRELLRDPARAPVLVLATLWPQYWDTLTVRPPDGQDPYPQARDLLVGHDVTVPAAFTPAQLGELARSGDARLVMAATAEDGQVIQFLAGAPELVSRYHHAPPAAQGLISAAMDARRLGMGVGMPRAFLEAAAPGYLVDSEWDGLGEDWLERALAYLAVPAKGARGPLTRIRPRPAASRDSGEQPTGGPSVAAGGPLYRLADYLDQYGRTHRQRQFPPAEFWTAAATHASPVDQTTLGDAAYSRGLYRDAAQIRRNAAALGSTMAARKLVTSMHLLDPADRRPADWAVSHADLRDPREVAYLLESLRETGAEEQIAALMARDPAAQAELAHQYGVTSLLIELRKAGQYGQVDVLASRAVAHVDLSDTNTVFNCLHALLVTGTVRPAATLLARNPAARVDLLDPNNVAYFIETLLKARTLANGAGEQLAEVLGRDPAAHVDLARLKGVAHLLDMLRQARAEKQFARLANRAVSGADLSDSDGVARLLTALRVGGANSHIATLLARDPVARTGFGHLGSVADLLLSLWVAGARDQFSMLASQAAALSDLEDPEGVVRLLRVFREAGAEGQIVTLASRAAAEANLGDPRGVAQLLDGMREARASAQVAVLLARDPAERVDLGEPGGVGQLLYSLGKAGADAQVAALLARDPAAHADLENWIGIEYLLFGLQTAGAGKQAVELARQLPSVGMFSLYCRFLWVHFRFGQGPDEIPASSWSWDDLG